MTTPTSQLASIISRSRITLLYPGIRPLVYRVLEDVYITTRRRMNVVEGIRPFDYQLQLYAKGRRFVPEGKGADEALPMGMVPAKGAHGHWIIGDEDLLVTNAKPGLSWHCYGLAFDAAWAGKDPWLKAEPRRIRDELWAAFAQAVRIHGMESSADFHKINGLIELDHAQMRYGLRVSDVLEVYEQKGLTGVWAWCDRIRGVPLGQDWGPGE